MTYTNRQYAINNNYSNAVNYYDKVIDTLKKSTDTNTSFVADKKTLIDIYQDKAKIEQYKKQYDKAVDLIKEAILVAEQMY